MPGPQVTIDLERIERNARTVVTRCRASGINVFGVTKGTCGMPQVARAMLRGGVTGIGESRFENIRRLRASGIDAPVMLLRSPPLSLIEEVIKTVDISLNSELATIRELSRVAERMARVHDIILMVDLGDLREGIWPSDLMPTVEQVMQLPGVRIAGIGTNLTCFGAIIPTEINLGELAGHAEKIRSTFGLDLTHVSGGNSSSLPLLLAGRMPKGINHLRIGEAILQGGRDTFHDEPWAELDRDIFLLSGELLEVKTKPSLPIGTMGVDAFGGRPRFEDRGERLRGIVNIGREDVAVEGLTPLAAGIEVLGASSDHLILDVAEAKPTPQLGDRIAFRMSYAALLAAMTSEYVEKTPMFDRHEDGGGRRVSIFADQLMADRLRSQEIEARLQALDYATALRGAPGEAAIREALRQGDIPLMFGLDHRTTLAGLNAVAGQADSIGLLWFDAQAALEPPAPGAAEVAAECVLHRALGIGGDAPSLLPRLSPENVVLIGLREISPRESHVIRQSRLKIFTMADIDALGIREVIRQALRIATAGTRGFYVSYSPTVSDIPGTHLGSGGLTIRETHQAMEAIAQASERGAHGMLAMDMVRLGEQTEQRAVSESLAFMLSAFGKTIL
jgi:predicted amino acid racemase/arginase family enzyme